MILLEASLVNAEIIEIGGLLVHPHRHRHRRRARPDRGRARRIRRCVLNSVVRTTDLTKEFDGGLLAVDGVDLDVQEGDLFGFLGPNGAGKTTTIRMLLGADLSRPAARSRSSARTSSHHLQEALNGVGTMVEGPAFYPYLSGERNLVIFDGAGEDTVKATRKKRIREVMERVGLGDVERPCP